MRLLLTWIRITPFSVGAMFPFLAWVKNRNLLPLMLVFPRDTLGKTAGWSKFRQDAYATNSFNRKEERIPPRHLPAAPSRSEAQAGE